jgi:hypothetical protein
MKIVQLLGQEKIKIKRREGLNYKLLI